jgi:hypothetical protein
MSLCADKIRAFRTSALSLAMASQKAEFEGAVLPGKAAATFTLATFNRAVESVVPRCQGNSNTFHDSGSFLGPRREKNDRGKRGMKKSGE